MSATYYSSSSPIAEQVQQQETMFLHKKQGIVTFLGSDLNRDITASKKKCLSHDDSFSSSSEGEATDEERFQIWSTIQRDNNNEKDHENPPAKLDTWSSILFDKAKEEENSHNSVTPYIHPLVKRSKSSLSKQSLEICTESLGSETGSDHVLSSDNSNYSSPSETEEEEEELQVPRQNLHHHVVMMKKCEPRCFPPPLPSLHMRSHRDGNGRLFLEAVTVASQNTNFCAQRQDGRLVLTFASDEQDQKDEVEEELELEEEFEEEFMGFEEEYEEDENYDDEGEAEEEDEVVEVEAVMEEEEPLLSSGVITNNNVQRLAFMMNNKPIGVINRNTTNWSHKFNEVVNFEGGGVEQQQHGLVAQSLRPRVVARLIPSAPAASAGSLNAYDCYWGTKHTSKVEHNKYSSSVMMKNNDRGSKVIFYGDVTYWNSSDGDQQKLVVMRGKNGDYLVHKAKSCKDSRRSFLFWEPRCIAT